MSRCLDVLVPRLSLGTNGGGESSPEGKVGRVREGIFLVTLGSLMLGLIPNAYVSVFGKTQPPTPVPIAAGEAGVWSVFGEKQDASTGVLRQ